MRRRSVTWLALCALPILLAASAAQASPGSEELAAIQQFVTLMKDYLDVSEFWMTMLSEPDLAAFLVAEGITEIYEEKGDKAGAIPELEKMLVKYEKNATVVRAIRFKLRDIYKETGQTDKALSQLRAILDTDTR
jgi:hypothetical protein